MAMELVPYITVGDGPKAIEFYKAAFGATELVRMPKKGSTKLMHAQLQVGSTKLYLSDDFPEMCEGKSRTPTALGGTPVTLHLNVDDCDKAVEKATKAGATVTMPPMDMFWGDRFAKLTDPFGHDWSLTSPLTEERKKAAIEAQKDWM